MCSAKKYDVTKNKFTLQTANEQSHRRHLSKAGDNNKATGCFFLLLNWLSNNKVMVFSSVYKKISAKIKCKH